VRTAADHDLVSGTTARTMRRLNCELTELYRREPDAWRGPVLEAGGGSFSHFILPPQSSPVVLDIDRGQLMRNATGAPGILGDVQQLPIASTSCSMVVCFNVLEHLQRPELAIDEMVRILRPGGLLLLGFPDRNSLKGWITRLTPISLHRAFYRYVVGRRDRGGAHYDAFETPFRPLVGRASIANRLTGSGFEILWQQSYDGALEYGLTTGTYRRRLTALPYYAACGLGRMLALGRWRPADSDVLLLARKPATPGTPA
jgi:SAM-dependent methyltransferase